MPLPARLRVDGEQGDLGPRRAGVGVLGGADRDRADDLRAGAGDEQPVHALGGSGEALAPGAGEGVGLEQGDDLVGYPAGVGRPEDRRLDLSDGRGVGGPRPADAGVGGRPGTGTGPVLVRVLAHQ